MDAKGTQHHGTATKAKNGRLKFELVINVKAAQALGVMVPPLAARHRRRSDRLRLDCTATGSSALRESGPDLRAFDWLED